MKNKAHGRMLASVALFAGLMGGGPMMSGEGLAYGDQVAIQAFKGGGRRKRRKKVIRRKTLFSARLGPFDPRPTTGGSPLNRQWKAYWYSRYLAGLKTL